MHTTLIVDAALTWVGLAPGAWDRPQATRPLGGCGFWALCKISASWKGLEHLMCKASYNRRERGASLRYLIYSVVFI